MRALRLTYPGALHYIKHRGKPGDDIFWINRDKVNFLDLMKQKCVKSRVRIFAYCIMNNDGQLVVENTGGMPEYFKDLNSKFASLYRNRHGGKGPVFHDRYYSAVIQDREYLKKAITYILMTPVREGIAETADEYLWSSTHAYFEQKESDLVDLEYMRRLFGRRIKIFHSQTGPVGLDAELPVVKSKEGHIIGKKVFLKEAVEKYREHLD